MFVTRRIDLNGAQELALGALIKAERLELCLTVERILARAHEQAEAVVAAAEQEAQRRLDAAQQRAVEVVEQARRETEQRVWQEAEALLDGLRRAEQELWAEVERHAEQVLQAALMALLGDIDSRQRIQVLVRRLVEAQRELVSATLYCTPERQECVRTVVEDEHLSRWRIMADPRLATDQLVLETDAGVFRCCWSAIAGALSGAEGEAGDGQGTEGR
jgi:type III secretion protein L